LEAGLVDIKVASEAGIDPGCEHEFAALELPQEIKSLAGPTYAATPGVSQSPVLKAIDPLAARLAEFEDARLAAVDHLVEEPEQPDSIDGAERGGLRLGAGLAFALGEELHTAVTGHGTPSLPV
jgi:hypothetical protein